MFLIKVVGEKHINAFSTDNYEIYVGSVKLLRNGWSQLDIPLEEDDIIYIMDVHGNTIDSLSPRLEE